MCQNFKIIKILHKSYVDVLHAWKDFNADDVVLLCGVQAVKFVILNSGKYVAGKRLFFWEKKPNNHML